MESQFLSRFTPSLMTPDALEAIFVQREELLQSILERIGISALTQSKQNSLLVGPRGIGKTHLISMIYYRLSAVGELKDRLLTAWLREEEWGVSSFRDLLFRILRALTSGSAKDQVVEQRLASLYELDSGEVESAASGLIKEIAGKRTILILAENFDDLLQKLGRAEELKLYRFLRESGFCCMVATSPGPMARVFPSGSPFQQDFFRVEVLRELNFEDAVQLISKIARFQNDRELISLIDTPRGRSRVRALRYLAGGNHRAYVVFAPLLAHESIEELVRPLMETVDDLTPYYNSRIAALPVEQRKIIEFVCEDRHPVRVADVSRASFIGSTTASAQLESLCKLGHLHSFQIGEDRYYELREPLMRLSFEVKKHRGKPIGLLLDFLRLWYSPAELKQKLAALPTQDLAEQNYFPPLETLEQRWEDPRIGECCGEYNDSVQSNDYGKALKAAEELAAVRGLKQDLMAEAFCLIRLGQLEEAAQVYDRILASNPRDAEALRWHAWILNRIGRYEEALSSCSKSIQFNSDSGETWCTQASIFVNLSRPGEALNACDVAIRLDNKDAVAWTTRGAALADLELFPEALEAFSKAVELEPKNPKARMHMCAALIELNRPDEALEQVQKAIELSPAEAGAWVLKGSALCRKEQHDESLDCFRKAISLGEGSSFVRYKVVELLLALDRWREAAANLDEALDRFARSENPDAGDTGALIRRLIPGLFDPKITQLSIKVLLLIYQKHNMLGALGQGLIGCIPDVMSSTALSDEDASLWLESWQMMAAKFREFHLPVRLLDSAIRYRETHDLGVFMALPQEERKLLEPLVGVQVEAIA